jgi:hypothetical protein
VQHVHAGEAGADDDCIKVGFRVCSLRITLHIRNNVPPILRILCWHPIRSARTFVSFRWVSLCQSGLRRGRHDRQIMPDHWRAQHGVKLRRPPRNANLARRKAQLPLNLLPFSDAGSSRGVCGRQQPPVLCCRLHLATRIGGRLEIQVAAERSRVAERQNLRRPIAAEPVFTVDPKEQVGEPGPTERPLSSQTLASMPSSLPSSKRPEIVAMFAIETQIKPPSYLNLVCGTAAALGFHGRAA